MQFSFILLVLASVASALPACPGTQDSNYLVARQQQQEQSQQPEQKPQQQSQQPPQCSLEMLTGFRVLAPVNFMLKPEEAQKLLPSGGKYIDSPFNSTIFLQSRPQQPQGNATESIEVKFKNETKVSTQILQNSAYAISWTRNSSASGSQQSQQNQTASSSQQSQQNQSESGSQQMQISPIRVQLVDVSGKLSNVTDTLGVLSSGANATQSGQGDSQKVGQSQQQSGGGQSQQGGSGGGQSQQGGSGGGQSQQGGSGGGQSQQGGGGGAQPQPSANQTQSGSQQQESGDNQEDQGGAVVVQLGDEIPAGLYAFLISANISQPQGDSKQPQSNVTCRILTQPFQLRSSTDLTTSDQDQMSKGDQGKSQQGQQGQGQQGQQGQKDQQGQQGQSKNEQGQQGEQKQQEQ